MSKHITHWIDGRAWERRHARHGDLHDPATGAVTGSVDFAVGGGGRRRGRPRPRRRSRGWRAASLAKRTPVLFAFRELLNPRKDELAALITAEHGKVLSDALGEVARGLEVVEFACGIPHLLKGGVQRAASRPASTSYSIRQPLGVVGDHHAVQLPGDGADVVLPDRDRGRQHRRAQAEREGPVGLALAGRAVEARPACPTASSTSCTATRRPSTRCSTHPDVQAVSLRRLDADRAVHLRDRHRARQARAGPRRREEPHGRAARRRPRPGRRRRGQRRLRLGRRALHGDLGRWSRSDPIGDELVAQDRRADARS